ncbi:MAG: hypothetical protein FWG10_01080 [Eubacteriaceae bacterium]|nr:hypothetical protein [Eubacteriaceae bacterium]
MKKTIMKTAMTTLALLVLAGLVAKPLAAFATNNSGVWLAGDFHTHSYFSDGSHTPSQVAEMAKLYGLDWISAADHGGAYVGKKDAKGNRWSSGDAYVLKDGNGFVMPRWATIYKYGEDAINQNREGGFLQISGFEWNVPNHSHASVGIIGENANEHLAVFEYLYDSARETYDAQTSILKNLERGLGGKEEAGEGSNKASSLTNNSHEGALLGAGHLQSKFQNTSYFLPNHPSRSLNFTLEHFREFNDIAPDVFFGAEFLPGHQSSAFRGDYSIMNLYDSVKEKYTNIKGKDGDTIEAKLDTYINELAEVAADSVAKPPKGAQQAVLDKYAADVDHAKNQIFEQYNPLREEMLGSVYSSIAIQRTYGGADIMMAKVGGVWDAMLSEGRRFWAFGNSDFHANKQGVSDIDFWPGQFNKNYVFATDRSYQGILDGMRSGNCFLVTGDLVAALDFTISNNNGSATMGQWLPGSKDSANTITIRFMSPAENHNGNSPKVDHIDVIAGTVTRTQEEPDTAVILSIGIDEFEQGDDNWMSATFELPNAGKDTYYRLRGTNNPNGSENVDDAGNPTIDVPIDSVAGTNTPQIAFDDLWFYSNPVFAYAPIRDVAIVGKLVDANNRALASTRIFFGEQSFMTDRNGRFKIESLDMGKHSLAAVSAAGKPSANMFLEVGTGEANEFSNNAIWLELGTLKANVVFAIDSGSIQVKEVSIPEDVKKYAPIVAIITVIVLCIIIRAAMRINKRRIRARQPAKYRVKPSDGHAATRMN